MNIIRSPLVKGAMRGDSRRVSISRARQRAINRNSRACRTLNHLQPLNPRALKTQKPLNHPHTTYTTRWSHMETLRTLKPLAASSPLSQQDHRSPTSESGESSRPYQLRVTFWLFIALRLQRVQRGERPQQPQFPHPKNSAGGFEQSRASKYFGGRGLFQPPSDNSYSLPPPAMPPVRLRSWDAGMLACPWRGCRGPIAAVTRRRAPKPSIQNPASSQAQRLRARFGVRLRFLALGPALGVTLWLGVLRVAVSFFLSLNGRRGSGMSGSFVLWEFHASRQTSRSQARKKTSKTTPATTWPTCRKLCQEREYYLQQNKAKESVATKKKHTFSTLPGHHNMGADSVQAMAPAECRSPPPPQAPQGLGFRVQGSGFRVQGLGRFFFSLGRVESVAD